MFKKKKKSSHGTLINAEEKLHVRRGKCTIFHLKEFDAIFENASKKLQIPVEPAMSCDTQVRYTSTQAHRKDTNAESCSVTSRREETPSIERTATLFDQKGKANKSVRAPNVYTSQRVKPCA